RSGLYRGWGMHADDADLQIVLGHLWVTQEPRVIAKLLIVFSNRSLPEFDIRLIELCKHSDPQVRQRAFKALEKNAHPMIRKFALAELNKRRGPVIGLFTKNYRQGDEKRILESIRLPEEKDELHSLLMDVIEVLENNQDAECLQLGTIAYALTPC